VDSHGHELAPKRALGSLGAGDKKLAVAKVHVGRSPGAHTMQSIAGRGKGNLKRARQPVPVVVPINLRILEEP
jgi:hypothetical protein